MTSIASSHAGRISSSRPIWVGRCRFPSSRASTARACASGGFTTIMGAATTFTRTARRPSSNTTSPCRIFSDAGSSTLTRSLPPGQGPDILRHIPQHAFAPHANKPSLLRRSVFLSSGGPYVLRNTIYRRMFLISPRRLYLDNAATSFPKPPGVTEAMVRYATELGASAGRGAYREAVETGSLITECRRRLNRLFNGQNPDHFIFTLNCSDGLNLAIKGLIDPREQSHAICTQIDHNSILRPLRAMEEYGWIETTRAPIDPGTGLVYPDDIRRAIRPDTRLIALTHASNVTGTLQPIREIGRIAREAGVPLVVDAAQSAGHVPIDLQADGIDLLAAPGHKALLGPLGTGFLYIRAGLETQLRPLKEGGTGSISEQDR